MAETSETLTISLKLGSRELRPTIKREEEQIYREAAKLINSRFSFYANKFPHQGDEVYLTMTVLDIAVLYKHKEHETDLTPIMNTLGGLLAEVEAALK